MKLPRFLDTIDKCTQNMTHEQLEIVIHEIARTLPEGKRGGFLFMLESIAKEDNTERKNDGKEALIVAIRNIKPRIMAIRAGEVSLDSEYNEEWDDWYNSDEPEVLFMDPENLLDDIQEAIGLVHKCFDMEMYQEGYELFCLLKLLSVDVTGDYNDYAYGGLFIDDLYSEELLSGRYETFLNEGLYLAYVANKLSDRPRILYEIIELNRNHEINLESILQMGDRQLPEIKEFLYLWIAYLGNKNGRTASNLLREALSMIDDDSVMLENARGLVENHPEIYFQILENKDRGKDDVKLHIGLEAIDRVPEYLNIRSSIALMTAYYAERLNKLDTRDKCWLEAFRSDTDVVNYMRIKLMSNDPEKYNLEISNIIHSVFEKSGEREIQHFYENEKRNYISEKEYCTLLFFEKLFDKMELVGMNTKEDLGWTSTYMKEGLALLLLLLFSGEEYREGMEVMLNNAIRACGFSKEDIYEGTTICNDETDEEVFLELFENWKVNVVLTDEEKEYWIHKVEEWIKRRTRGIMAANKRNYYEECASYISAFGEVVESLGCKNGKMKIMNEFKEEYKRRRLFIAELHRFGMR